MYFDFRVVQCISNLFSSQCSRLAGESFCPWLHVSPPPAGAGITTPLSSPWTSSVWQTIINSSWTSSLRLDSGRRGGELTELLGRYLLLMGKVTAPRLKTIKINSFKCQSIIKVKNGGRILGFLDELGPFMVVY